MRILRIYSAVIDMVQILDYVSCVVILANNMDCGRFDKLLIKCGKKWPLSIQLCIKTHYLLLFLIFSILNFFLKHFALLYQKPLEAEDPEEYHETPIEVNESEEYWNQTLASFKEQALKVQSVSQEAYEEYSKRAVIILGETSKQLKIHAEKAKKDLTVIAEEVSKEGKQYLSKAADESPEPVKDIVQTFASSSNELNEVSQVRDFYIGIPYGMYTLTSLIMVHLISSIASY